MKQVCDREGELEKRKFLGLCLFTCLLICFDQKLVVLGSFHPEFRGLDYLVLFYPCVKLDGDWMITSCCLSVCSVGSFHPTRTYIHQVCVLVCTVGLFISLFV